MSEEKIVSKLNLINENDREEIKVIEADPTIDNSAKIVEESIENAKVENDLVEEEVRKPSIDREGSFVDTQKHPLGSVHDDEHLQDEELIENLDASSKIDEIFPDDEIEEYTEIIETKNLKEPNVVLQQKTRKIVPVTRVNLDDLADLGSYSSESEYSFETEILQTEEAAKLRDNLIQMLGKVPNISDISIALTEDLEPEEIESLREEQEMEELVNVEESTASSQENIEEDVSEECSFEDFDILFEPYEIQEKLEKPKEKVQEDAFDLFLETNRTDRKIGFYEEEEEKVENLRMLQIVTEHVDKFLRDIIKRVVEYVSAMENTYIVRKKLRKEELFKKIVENVYELKYEMFAQSFLYRKSLEYFRRRLLMRYITPEKPDQRPQEYEKYIEAIERLDKLLGEENFITRKTASRIAALENEKIEIEKAVEMETKDFEKLVLTTLRCDGKPNLEEFIKKDLRKIRELSKDITEVRLRVIQQQHALGTLRVEIDNLENLGDGLRVADYEAIQRQTVAVSKKIEERNRDLNRLFDRFHSSLHILTHSKLRNELLTKRTTTLAMNLESCINEKTTYRMAVYELKKQRQKIKWQMGDLSLQSGLVDKPILLHDYDETNERVGEKRKLVEELRLTQKKLEQKLKQLERGCATK